MTPLLSVMLLGFFLGMTVRLGRVTVHVGVNVVAVGVRVDVAPVAV